MLIHIKFLSPKQKYSRTNFKNVFFTDFYREDTILALNRFYIKIGS